MWSSAKRHISSYGYLGIRRFCNASTGLIKVSDEVSEALSNREPVVALESTIITHGMPYPANLETAQKVESTVRSTGCIPATVGIIDGHIHVGMKQSELEFLAKSENVVKTSRRDLPIVLSEKLSGGTTVSATMIAAHKAGIPIFVTGGIGGVHRGAEDSMDISSDLTELGRTPIAVVCAGVKSILDIGRTLEFLETQGVPVIKYGNDRSMPAFFTSNSLYETPYNVETPTKAAQCIAASLDLQINSGMVVAVPIPAELSVSGAVIENAIQTALKETSEKKIFGKQVTPYVLQRVNELTKGQSLRANTGLILNNARVGGQIAKALAEIRFNGGGNRSRNPDFKLGELETMRGGTRVENYGKKCNGKILSETAADKRVVVIGGSILDFNVKIGTEKYDLNGATYPGGVRQLIGGVGRNLADCLSRLDMVPLFISAVGADGPGQTLLEYCQNHMSIRGIRRFDGAHTACYAATIEQDGQVILGVSDMDIHGRITPELVGEFESELKASSFVLVDGNIPVATIEYVTKFCNKERIPVLYEPTDIHQAGKAWTSGDIMYSSPNIGELLAMYDTLTGSKTVEDLKDLSKSPLENVLAYIREICLTVVDRIPNLWVTLGANGLLVCRRAADIGEKFPTRGESINEGTNVVAINYSSQIDHPIVSVSGAGDCMVSAMVAAILRGHNPDIVCKAGMKSASHSLSSFHPVPPDMSSKDYSPEVVMKWANSEGHVIDLTGNGKNMKVRS